MVDGVRRKCKFLVKVGNKTLCRIYKTRLGTVIFKQGEFEVTCNDRLLQKQHHDGCPYNKEVDLECHAESLKESQKDENRDYI